MVDKQLTAEEHNIVDKFQSGFPQLHSTKTALLRVSNRLLMQADPGECSIVILPGLSAAFDTVDPRILIERLRQ